MSAIGSVDLEMYAEPDGLLLAAGEREGEGKMVVTRAYTSDELRADPEYLAEWGRTAIGAAMTRLAAGIEAAACEMVATTREDSE